MIAADDVAPPRQHHCLSLVVDLLAAFAHHQRHERRRIVEHELTHQLVGALAHAEDVEQAACLELGQCLGTDQTAVGDHAHPGNGEAPAGRHLGSTATARITGQTFGR